MAVRPYKKHGVAINGEWEIDYYPQGRQGQRVQRKFVGTEAEALAVEMELRRISRSAPIRSNPKLVDCWPDWMEDYQNNRLPNTVRDVKNCNVHLIPFFGGMWFSELSPSVIEQYKSQRLADGVSKRTVNKELSYLSSFLGWCYDHRHADPLPFKIRKFPANQTRPPKPRIPTRDEIEAIISHIEDEYRCILLLMYDAGLRRSEALNLKAEDVRAGVIFVLGKGNKERVLPITTDRLREELERAKEKAGRGWLFVNPKTGKPWYSIRKALRRAAEAAGVEGRVYHHLMRHSFGTHALSDGVNLRALQGMMGHSTSKVTETYTHLLDDYLVAEAAKIKRPPTTPASRKRRK